MKQDESAANVVLVDGEIGDPRTAAKIVDTAVSRFGRIDVLINNAGVFIPKPFTEYTTEEFDTLVSTTLTGFHGLYSRVIGLNLERLWHAAFLFGDKMDIDPPTDGHIRTLFG
jgi:NAD(P)-dependent dehydrogenase (short-subunit alcohol dehydrogenase family)